MEIVEEIRGPRATRGGYVFRPGFSVATPPYYITIIQGHNLLSSETFKFIQFRSKLNHPEFAAIGEQFGAISKTRNPKPKHSTPGIISNYSKLLQAVNFIFLNEYNASLPLEVLQVVVRGKSNLSCSQLVVRCSA